MAGKQTDTAPSRRGLRRAAAMLCVVALACLAIAPAALAGGPASGQYTLHVPSAGNGGGAAPGTHIGGSGGSDAAFPLLALGAAAIAAGAGALVYVRWRRRGGATA